MSHVLTPWQTLSSKDLVADYKKAYSTADFEKAASGSEYKEYLEQVRREHKDAVSSDGHQLTFALTRFRSMCQMAKVGDLVTKIKDGIAQLKEEKQQVIQVRLISVGSFIRAHLCTSEQGGSGDGYPCVRDGETPGSGQEVHRGVQGRQIFLTVALSSANIRTAVTSSLHSFRAMSRKFSKW